MTGLALKYSRREFNQNLSRPYNHPTRGWIRNRFWKNSWRKHYSKWPCIDWCHFRPASQSLDIVDNFFGIISNNKKVRRLTLILYWWYQVIKCMLREIDQYLFNNLLKISNFFQSTRGSVLWKYYLIAYSTWYDDTAIFPDGFLDINYLNSHWPV